MKLRHLPLVLLLSLPAVALAKGWVKDPNTGCEIWTNTADAASWDGACVGGKANGSGTMAFRKDGKSFSTYKGEVEDGESNGQGVCVWANGERYEGQFKDGKTNGQGVRTWANGDRHEGQWKDDKKHGQGVFVNANGDRYEGQYKDDKRNGQGVFVWANGDRYEGQWKDDKKHGQGEETYKDGQRYEGAFKNNKKNGLGRQTAADGSLIHEGQWQDDQPVRVAAAAVPVSAPVYDNSADERRRQIERGQRASACRDQCRATQSNMEAMCAGMSDTATSIFDSSPKIKCAIKVDNAYDACNSSCNH